MESISKKTGKKFTGKFADIAVKIGIADNPGESEEVKPKVKTPSKKAPAKKASNKKAPKKK
jgi:hypothetical protein